MNVFEWALAYLLMGFIVNLIYRDKIYLGMLIVWPLFIIYRIYLDIKYIFGSW